MTKSSLSTFEIGQIVTVRVERVLFAGVDVRLNDGTPAYVRWRDMTRCGHWDPNKMVAVGREVVGIVVAIPRCSTRL